LVFGWLKSLVVSLWSLVDFAIFQTHTQNPQIPKPKDQRPTTKDQRPKTFPQRPKTFPQIRTLKTNMLPLNLFSIK
jgi:hypothetical protein